MTAPTDLPPCAAPAEKVGTWATTADREWWNCACTATESLTWKGRSKCPDCGAVRPDVPVATPATPGPDGPGDAGAAVDAARIARFERLVGGPLTDPDEDVPPAEDPHFAAARAVAATVVAKSAAYGDAITRTAAIMAVLFPRGIPPERYVDAGLMWRAIDKLCRLSTAPAAFGESPWEDLAGYALRGVVESARAAKGGAK